MKKSYATDLNDGEWKLIEPCFPKGEAGSPNTIGAGCLMRFSIC